MREYDTGMSRTLFVVIIAAIVVSSGFMIAAFWAPDGPNGPTTTPPTTTPTTSPPGGGYGALAAEYLNSRRDDVVFMFTCNNTMVNVELTAHYQQTEPTAYVDGVYMRKDGSSYSIDVLFAPYDHNIVGHGEITQVQWETMSGAIVDDGLAQMADATTHPENWPSEMPAFYVSIYFDDNTFFYFGYTSTDGFVWIMNGTWSGSYNEWGWPQDTSHDYENGRWLVEGGHLQTPISVMRDTITGAVSYPEG
ncbi:MAG: hypothetical protein JSW61_10460 [Candidatus Thorarchaeota archaeon]|nr:MAG: hypothetical protein JSW61_10460 [Candidatus Thorarchaeota archaeon]